MFIVYDENDLIWDTFETREQAEKEIEIAELKVLDFEEYEYVKNLYITEALNI